jgi:hypothetical protein
MAYYHHNQRSCLVFYIEETPLYMVHINTYAKTVFSAYVWVLLLQQAWLRLLYLKATAC